MTEPDTTETGYCPRCVSAVELALVPQLETRASFETWTTCPKHGDIHIEYYEP